MADNFFNVCNICHESMINPKILLCAHSFCLKCLESLKESKCPTCQIYFEIPDGGLMELKKNEFIERLSNLNPIRVNCDFCKENEAIKFCFDCNCNYCSKCLQIHERIPATSDHIYLPVNHLTNIGEYSTCKVHTKTMDFYCKIRNDFACIECVELNHKNHRSEIIQVREHFELIIKNLKDKIKMENKLLKDVLCKYRNKEEILVDNEQKAIALKKQIHERAENIKMVVDSIAKKIYEDIDEELQKYKETVKLTLMELKHIKIKLKSEIESLENQLKGLNHINCVKLIPQVIEIKEKVTNTPSYSEHFCLVSHFCLNNKYINQLHKFMGIVLEVQPVKDLKIITSGDVILSVAAIQNNIFVVSNRNEIQVFSHNGFNLKEKYNYNNIITYIVDSVAVDNKLYVAGCKDDKNDVIMIKSDLNHCDKPEIFKVKILKDNFKLSRSVFDHVLIVLKREIIHFSECGNVLKRCDLKSLKFDIEHAMEVNESSYVICSTHTICIINCHGEILKRCMSRLMEPSLLDMDNYGCIYACALFPGKILVLDFNLNLLESYNNPNLIDIQNMCYNDANHSLTVVCKHEKLVNVSL